jgi:hypothetical protein
MHRSILLSLLVLAASPMSLTAGWIEDGTPVSTLIGDASNVGVFSDGADGVMIAYLQSAPGGRQVRAIRITRNGDVSPGWPADGAVIRADGDAQLMRLSLDNAGGAFMSWTQAGGAEPGFYVQHVVPDGPAAPGWPAGGKRLPILGKLTTDAAGGFHIVWAESRTVSFPGGSQRGQGFISSHRFDEFGNDSPLWSPSRQELFWATDVAFDVWAAVGAGWDPFVAIHEHGSFHGTYLSIKRVSDSPAGIQHLFSLPWYNGAQLAGLYSDGAGGVVATSVGYDWSCGCQRADVGWHAGSTGSLKWIRTFSSTAYEVSGFASHVLPQGGSMYVAWHDDRETLGTPRARILRVGADGVPSPGWTADGMLLAALPGMQVNTQMAADGTGGAIGIWQDRRAADWNLYTRRVLASGQFASDETPLCVAPGDQVSPQIVAVGPDEAVAVWLDRRNGDWDVFAGLVSADGPVSASASLVSVQAAPGGVRLVWSIVDGTGLDATVLRMTEGGPWIARDRVAVDGSGVVRYEDTDVLPGARYGYRLGIVEQGIERFFGEAWVTIPRADFALEGMTPNPSAGSARIAFTLPDRSPATLDLLDVTGRQVVRHDVGSRGAGRHVVDATTAELAPGVYVIRLIRGDATLTARAAVVR